MFDFFKKIKDKFEKKPEDDKQEIIEAEQEAQQEESRQDDVVQEAPVEAPQEEVDFHEQESEIKEEEPAPQPEEQAVEEEILVVSVEAPQEEVDFHEQESEIKEEEPAPQPEEQAAEEEILEAPVETPQEEVASHEPEAEIKEEEPAHQPEEQAAEEEILEASVEAPQEEVDFRESEAEIKEEEPVPQPEEQAAEEEILEALVEAPQEEVDFHEQESEIKEEEPAPQPEEQEKDLAELQESYEVDTDLDLESQRQFVEEEDSIAEIEDQKDIDLADDSEQPIIIEEDQSEDEIIIEEFKEDQDLEGIEEPEATQEAEQEVFEDVEEELSLPEPEEHPQEEKKKGWFGLTLGTFKEKISKTSETLISGVVAIATGKETLDDDDIDEIEEQLIKADIGLDTAVELADKLRDNKSKISPDKLKDYLKNEFTEILLANKHDLNINYQDGKQNVYLVTGVNGVGKTTLIGKLAYRFKSQGKKVLIAAGDTFRAAAEEQLNIWSQRAGADIVRRDGADPASVVFDALAKAKNENYDVLLIDTAGRLHNKFNLMEELRKIRKIIDQNQGIYLAESMLVLDATTGQNGLQQAKVFGEAVHLSCVSLTKLDGSAKGGIIIAIASDMKLPVKLVGVGEKMEDLRDFDPEIFIEALFT